MMAVFKATIVDFEKNVENKKNPVCLYIRIFDITKIVFNI